VGHRREKEMSVNTERRGRGRLKYSTIEIGIKGTNN
jgi:hypothetical protein